MLTPPPREDGSAIREQRLHERISGELHNLVNRPEQRVFVLANPVVDSVRHGTRKVDDIKVKDSATVEC